MSFSSKQIFNLGDGAKQFFKEILFLLGDKKLKLPMMLVMFFAVSLLDLLGIGLIGPYIAVVVDEKQFSENLLPHLLTQIGLPESQVDYKIFLGILLIIVFLFKGFSAIVIHKAIVKFVSLHGVWLRTKLMDVYQKLPYTSFMLRNSSEYIQAIQIYTGVYSAVLNFLLKSACEGIIAIAIFSFLLWKYGAMLWLVFLMLAIFVFVYDRIFKKSVYNAGKQKDVHNQQAIKGIHEAVDGFKDIRIFKKENYFLDVVSHNSLQTAKFAIQTQAISIAPRYILEFLLVLILVTLVSGEVLYGGTTRSLIPILAVFAFASLRMLSFANLLATGLTTLRFQRHAVEMLYKDLHQTMEEKIIDNEESVEVVPIYNSFKELSFSEVYFKYPKTEQWALEGITFSIKRGDSIGLIGVSGAGKTTLVDLILGLLLPQEGKITYNQHSLKTTWADWNSHVAYLPQDVFLIDNTLRRNVALGIPDDEIDEQGIHEALRQSALYEFLDKLPNGLDTILGERGVRLSGGQKQRVALARAFYHGRDVLVLDESTSSLDIDTEQKIIEEIHQLKKQKTLIVIAHRYATLKHCDRILQLKDGKIVRVGSYNELYVRSSEDTN